MAERAARFIFGSTARSNFPRSRLAPLAPDALRRMAAQRYKTVAFSSAYRGVYFVPRCEARPWAAWIGPRTRRLFLGHWSTERDAAVAYDRAARHYLGPRARLNLPECALGSQDAESLLLEVRRAIKMKRSSPYLGVSWSKVARKWSADIMHQRRRVHLGLFCDERDAARAYDARAFALRGAAARLNFDRSTGAPIWGKRSSRTPPPGVRPRTSSVSSAS